MKGHIVGMVTSTNGELVVCNAGHLGHVGRGRAVARNMRSGRFMKHSYASLAIFKMLGWKDAQIEVY